MWAIRANILNYSSYVYGMSQPSAWVMLYNTADCSICHLAQTGWDEFGTNNGSGGSTRQTFAAYSSPSNSQYYEDHDPRGPQPVGTTSNYRVQYRYAGSNSYHNYYDFYLNGSVWDSQPSNFIPNAGQMMGEVGNMADQMAGGVASHETFTSSQYEDSGNTWLSFNGSTSSSSTYFTAYAASSSELDVWDDNCSY